MSSQDFMLEWGQDLVLNASGTLATVSGWPQVRERIIRRLLTNPAQTLPDGSLTAADYIFDTSYGVGGGALVSQNPTQAWITALQQRIAAAVLSDVAADPGWNPQVTVTAPAANTLEVFVGVQLSNTQQGTLSLTIGG